MRRRVLHAEARRTVRAGVSSALASPKSSTFTVPSSRTLIFAGFRSRWTIPCSCAACSAPAICRAIGSASSSGRAPRAIRCDEILSFDQLHHQSDAASALAGRSTVPYTWAICGWLRAASIRASRAKRASLSGSRAKRSGITLIATSRCSLRVARAVDLAHAAGADTADDFVGVQTRP